MIVEPAIGSLLSDRYLLVEELGRGAMGIVYRADHTLLDRSVAIKVLHLTSAELVARFQREARLLARIDHDNVCGVTDFGTTADPADGGAFFLVMEHVEGDTLANQLVKNGRLPVPRALPIFRQVAEGLAHCHDVGVIHRDLKPDNIMVSRDGFTGHATAKIIDFGIAIAANREPGSSRVTQANVVLGTPAFMSPEQATGAVLDARSDLYALGVVIYEAISGVNPFDTHDAVMTLANQLHLVPPALSAAAPDLDIPHALDVLVARLLTKSPADRPQSADEVAAALAVLERGGDTVLDLRPLPGAPTEAVAAPSPSDPAPPERARGRRRALLAAAALLLVALLIALFATSSGPDADPDAASSDRAAAAAAAEADPDAVPGLEILAHAVAADVVDREPRGVADRFTVDAGRVYCHAVVKNRSSHRAIVVAWSQDGEPRGEVDLRVGPSEGWHTWAVLYLAPNRVGAWRCDVRAPTGELLSSRAFTVAE